ncbi:nitrous oxide-stimulated promoter family protein [Endozoicomonadaceae bacterium StTr2]
MPAETVTRTPKAQQPLSRILAAEFKTIVAMTRIYCRDHHPAMEKSAGVCSDCQSFLDFARFRLVKCPYGDIKPTCKQCPVHCYKPDRKEQARIIMRYAGPRMLLPHPILAIRHLLHDRRPVPELPKRGRKAREAKNKNE